MIKNSSFEKEYFNGRARLVSYVRYEDERGVLLPLDFKEMPFEPCRTFVIIGASAGTIRGGHGHRTAQQMLFCLQGRIEILMRDSIREVSLLLKPGSSGLVFGPGIWCQQTYLDAGSILQVFASEPYDQSSYIESGT